MFYSCSKIDNTKNIQNENSILLKEAISQEGSEGIMEFAPETPNPYTIDNMQAALSELAQKEEFQGNNINFEIRPTHKYIKFTPIDSIQAGLLVQDTTLVLFDYPLDRKIIKGGTYYKDPSVEDDKPNSQWTCVPIDKQIPTGIEYEILSELYLPEEDPLLVEYYDTDQDQYITLLIDEALKRTDNYDTTDYYDGMTSGGELAQKLPSKWTPTGRIRLSDNVLNNITGLRGVKVRANRWFETRECLSDVNGNFNVLHQFRYPVNYSIKWERNDYNIRSGRYGQAYFNGPHMTGMWNLDIVSGLSWFYGTTHRAAFEYYYNNPTGLRTPPTNGFLGSRIAFGVFDQTGRAFYRRSQRNWFGPEIFLYNSEEDASGNVTTPNSLRHYETTIHELAHASHFNISHWHYRNTDAMVKESWAVGVMWAFARLRYTNPMDLQGLRLQNSPTQFDVVHWGERKYTPLVIDLIDNLNQRINFTVGSTDRPIDNVSGYTIRTIEDALVEKRTMNTWRDQLKINRPAGVTNAQIDELFLNYTPLQ